MRVLFVCSRNRRRSLTAEEIFRRSSEHQVRSAGTEAGARIRVSEKLVAWADVIYVMEKKHRARLFEKCPSARAKQVVVLDIPDDYEFMDDDLVEMLSRILP